MECSTFSTVGFLFAAYVLWEVARNIYHAIYLYVLPSFGFKFNPRKYGEWSVITGATSGIGQNFAYELAKRGSNVVLVGRNRELLNQTKNEITKKYGVEVKIIEKDLSNTSGYEVVKKELKDLDIGVLVNNAGIAHPSLSEIVEKDEKEFVDMVNVNITSYVMMVHIVLPKMVAKKKGVVVQLGSIVSFLPSFKYFGIYPSTKRFIRYFNDTLIAEYPFSKHGVYFHCVHPSLVSTKMSMTRAGGMCISAPDFAKACIDSFEYNGESSGCFVHFLQCAVAKYFPGWLTVYGATELAKSIKSKQDKKRQKTS